MKHWLVMILAACCLAAFASSAGAQRARPAGQRVMLVGLKHPFEEALASAGYAVESIERDALPADAAALAARCTVLVIAMDRLPEPAGRAIEAFVQGGGGLWIVAGDDWSRYGGGWLDQLSPGIGLDATREIIVRPRAVAGTPMEGIGVETMPALRAAGDASLPSAGRYGLMNGLSTWYFSKALWHDQWAEWVVGAPPREMALLSVARYGAGRTALWTGGRFNEPEVKRWDRLPAFCAAVVSYLAPRQRIEPALARPVQVRGFVPPAWWAEQLERGLAGMGQKATLADFVLPPESLLEAGFAPTDQPAERAILFGAAAAESPGAARIVLRAPPGAGTREAATFDPARLTLRPIGQVTFSGANVTLPHQVTAPADRLPALVTQPAPKVDLPAQWRMAFTHDPDSDADVQQRWFATDFDDSEWTTGPLARQQTELFGHPAGYDGAIWYRAQVHLPAEAVRPGCVLRISAEADQVALWSDGQPVASAPRQLVVPLQQLGAGEHLLAIRTYGELRRNQGITSVRVESLPLMWRADRQRKGWVERWYATDPLEPDWTPVGTTFTADPVAFGPLEGWLKIPVDVPADARPSVLTLLAALNTESQLFINGHLYGQRSHERVSMYRVPSTALRPGGNDLTMWVRFGDRQSRVVDVTVTPADPLVYTTTVESAVDGASLLATASYMAYRQERTPAEAVILVNGELAGGFCTRDSRHITLAAPGALRRGHNHVEIRLSAMPGEAVGLQSLGVVDTWPKTMPRPIVGWQRTGREGVSPQALPPTASWEAVQTVYLRDLVRPWMMSPTPDIGDPRYVYRTVLRVQPEELDRPWTLELRGSGINRIYVNGTAIEPHEVFYYPLNSALRPGDNVISFAVDESAFRGLNVRLPGGNDRYVYPPMIHHDRAPLVPADPSMAAYALNRLFTVAELPEPAGRGRVLLRWAHGTPAVTLSESAGRREIHCAPGLFDDLLPAPNMASRFKESGGRDTIEYDYIRRRERDGFLLEKPEQLLPALLNAAEGVKAFAGIEAGTRTVHLNLAAADAAGTVVAWRLLDWEGLVLASGASAPRRSAGDSAGVMIELPDLLAPTALPDASMGRVYRVRAALLTADRRKVLGWLERIVPVQPDVQVAVRLDEKLAGLDETTAEVSHRVLHRAIDQLVERSIYLPGETATATVFVTKGGPHERTLSVQVLARGAVDGRTVSMQRELRLLPGEQQRLEMPIDLGDREQAWRIEARIESAGTSAADARTLVVARPRGGITPFVEAHQDLRTTGGYMWQMSPHAFPIEHRLGTDARPVPEGKEWWTRVRHGGDGNWLVAQGIHRGHGDGDQGGLMWGPFYDQPRGEIMDSYGWFPNGRSIRQWWLPYAVREPLRQYGQHSVVLDLSDWWQNDAGYPYHNYQTFEMFQYWLKAREGQTIAGTKIEAPDLSQARTLRELHELVQRRYRRVYNYFHAEGLARTAAYTLEGFRAVTGPHTIQRGQGAFAHKLPSVIGGTDLAPTWTAAEGLGSLDADNHAFAGDWQYALEAATFRAWGEQVRLITHWEFPQRYHRIHSAAVANIPLGPAAWQRRQLDSRWLVCAFDGRFDRVLNLTHNEVQAGYAHDLFIGAYLPAHWRINDRLSALAMTVAVEQPLSPLLVVGESDLQWTDYYGGLGKLRDAGLRLGGAINIRELDAMPPERIPGLVWLPASHVDGKHIAAIVRKLEAGVPLLIVGRLPQTVGEGPDLAQVLRLQRAPEGKRATLEQMLTGEARTWPEADRVASRDAGPVGVALFEPSVRAPADDGAARIQPLVVRGDRMASGWGRDPRMKIVIHAVPPGLNNPDDAAVRRISIAAFQRLCDGPIQWDAASGGYALRGMDGQTYIVLQNMSNRPRTATLTLRQPAGVAVDLLSGRPLQVQRSGNQLRVHCPLPPEGATVIGLYEP